MDGVKIKTEGISGTGTLIKKKKRIKHMKHCIFLYSRKAPARGFFFFPALFNILER